MCFFFCWKCSPVFSEIYFYRFRQVFGVRETSFEEIFPLNPQRLDSRRNSTNFVLRISTKRKISKQGASILCVTWAFFFNGLATVATMKVFLVAINCPSVKKKRPHSKRSFSEGHSSRQEYLQKGSKSQNKITKKQKSANSISSWLLSTIFELF